MGFFLFGFVAGMGFFLIGLVAGASLDWLFVRRRDCYRREFNARRRGSNPPPPDLLPMPSAPGAERIYRGAMWRERGSDVWHPIGVPWEEGHTQRGNGHGGPSTPKPPIKPQPSGGHLISEGQLWGIYQPRPQSGTPNPPLEAP